MKQVLLLSYLLSLVCIAFAQNNTSFLVDGKSNKWKIPADHYDTRTTMSYGIWNDKNCLYLCFRTSDSKTKMRILRTGFQICIDTKGKKHTGNCLAYCPEQDMPMSHQIGQSPNIVKELTNLKLRSLVLSLKGFSSYPKGEYSTSNLKNIQFALDMDSTNMLTIEYKVPFSELSYQADTTKDISVGFYLLALDMPGGMMPPGGMSPPDGMSPPPGMSPPAGMDMPGGFEKSFQELTETKKLWVKYRIRNAR